MMIKCIIVSGILFCLISQVMARTWTNTQGKTIEAEVVRCESDRVVVKLPDGKNVSIFLKSLSAKDRAYVKRIQAMEFMEKARVWTMPDGQLLNAQLDAISVNFISVVDKDGNKVKIFHSELCPEDKQFVDDEARKRKSAEEKPDPPKKNSASLSGKNILTGEALHKAILGGNIKAVKSYIDHGGDVNVEYQGVAPLFTATEENKFAIMKLLINAGANLDFQDQWGASPIMRAASQGSFENFKLLLTSGAQLDIRHGSSGKTLLMVALEGNNVQIIKLLLKQGVDVLEKNEKTGMTAIREAYVNNSSPEIKKLLETAIADRKSKIVAEGGKVEEEEFSLTPYEVIMAVQHGDKALLKKYIAHKGNLDVKGRENDWYSPLIVGIMENRIDMVKILLDAGANIEFPATWGETPLTFAASTNPDMVRLLLAHGANVNPSPDDSGRTPLSEAIRAKNAQILKILIDHGADLITKNEKLRATTMQYAREMETPFIIVKLLEDGIASQKVKMRAKGEAIPEEDDSPSAGEISLAMKRGNKAVFQKYIDLKLPLDVRDRDGLSLLAVAATLKKSDFLKELMVAGADIEFPCSNNRTPITVASANGNLEHVRLLAEAGANVDREDDNCMNPLLCAIDGNYSDVIKFLLSKGASLKLPQRREEKNILNYARQRHADAKVMKMLKEAVDKEHK